MIIYDPNKKKFINFTHMDFVALPFDEVLLLNILIELRVHTEYLKGPGNNMNDPQDVRSIIAS